MTQVIDSAVETGAVNHDINLIGEFIDGWTTRARDLDPIAQLRVHVALGHVAAGVLELHAIDTTPLPNSQPAHEHVELSLVPVSEAAAEPLEPTEHLDVEILVTPLLEQQSELSKKIEKDLTSVEGKTPIDDIKDAKEVVDRYPLLDLSQREQAMLERLYENKGIKIRKADLTQGLEGTPTALQQAANKFLLKIKHSPYAPLLEITGATSSTRYLWKDGMDILKEASESEKRIPITQISQPDTMLEDQEIVILHEEKTKIDPVAILKGFGLDLHIPDQSKRYLTVRGVELKALQDIDMQILIHIAENKGLSYYKDLANDDILKSLGGTNIAKDLNDALGRISGTLKQHNIQWSDVSLPGEDGKKRRKLELGRPTPLSMDKGTRQDFLAPGLL